MEGDCASIESVLCFAAAKRTEARTIRHFDENFAGVLKYTVPMDKVCDNLSIGTCDGANRPAESLTKPATYPARGISAAPRLQETGVAQKIWTVEVNRVS